MRLRQALSKWALLWHGTNGLMGVRLVGVRLAGVRLAGVRPAGKRIQGGETKSPPNVLMQNSQEECGRGPRSDLGLPW